jgi:hypothetical protein
MMHCMRSPPFNGLSRTHVFLSLSQTHYPFPDSVPKLLAAYSYTLSHPGIPCIFWLHLYGKQNAAGVTNGVCVCVSP